MNIIVHTDISENYEHLEVVIKAKELSNEVNSIIDILQNFNDNIKKIIGRKDNDFFIINVEEIICFYSEERNNYCRTKNGVYRVKETLYELENKLLKSEFVRISNSCIININQVESFNTGIVGTIMVKFKDGQVEYVSRRKVSQVMKVLKGGK